MAKIDPLQKIEDHEKLCRIMQKQTHDRMKQLENQITRIERHMYYAMTALIGGMFTIIIILFQKL